MKIKTTIMQTLLLSIVSFFCLNCGNSDNLTPETTFPTAVSFTAVANDTQITLSWDNPQQYAYDIWRAIGDASFTQIVSATRGHQHIDRLNAQHNHSLIKYRMVKAGGNPQSETATQTEQQIRLSMASNDEMLDDVQRTTLKYFYDFAHPICKMARERSNVPADLDVVTTGGTGFGIMSLIVGAERQFITRAQAYEHLRAITDFLLRAERFHGAYAHWYYGSTGKVKPFSSKDNGGDLVETAFLIQGLLTAQSYFDTPSANAAEQQLVNDIQSIWEGVEWDFYTQGQNKLYWHWSKQYGFAMNMPISGWNEGLIVYVLAASSPTHSISKIVYDEGYARQGSIRNGNTYYGMTLPLGNHTEKGGPLFFTHYSFLGLNPTGLSDTYCNDYFEQNRHHVLINRAYCIDNPKNHTGYSKNFWGLTASDCPVNGYLAHAPGANDNGTITPTAALSSMPYAPKECLEVLTHLYRDLKTQLWGEYGFYDAINLSVSSDKQVYKSYLAIDQGPIIVMIENYRSGLIWNTFMQIKAIQTGLKKLGFQFPSIN
jgi:hypothetical protein